MSEELINNTLSGESSPYLLQHANNPVHWLAWNNDSLSIARRLNKPILLSIGYSACHWCHVMAHESFEDTETAEFMNKHFINIKVDKEERPDIDRIYQNAHSLLTERSGGWPLTVFITPDTHMPIFAGTYFPLHAKHGLPAFKSLLAHISEIWSSRKSDIQLQSNSLLSTYARIHEATKPTHTILNNTASDIARNQIEKQFDTVNGGFSTAPKFPHPAILEFAIKHWVTTRKLSQTDSRILQVALYSLERMAEGGIFDHLGGGFYRYSTDELWMVPHFEKMLYDNGPLLSLFSQAWQLNSDPVFSDTANEIATWVIREMQAPDGGYYSAQDADSEGIEGKFYVWSNTEINTLLKNATSEIEIDTKAIELFKLRFGLNLRANFEDSWHLHGYKNEAELAQNSQIGIKNLQQQFKRIRRYLLQNREKRIHPSTDTKILCAWNGLMIHGMAKAGRLLEKPEYTDSAIKAAYFLKTHCWKNNHLSANFKDGEASLNAYLDDYAFLIFGLLELLQSQWDNELYSWTLELADQLISQFEDSEYGGFYFTSHDHEKLIQRLKVFSDDAIPSGNAIAALSLTRLGYLSGKNQYNEVAGSCLKSAWTSINQAPISHCALLNALNEYLTPPNILVMRTVGSDVKSWQKITQNYHLADTMIYNIPADQALHSTLAGKAAGSSSLAYPCCGTQCQTPITTTNELHTFLRNNSYRVLE